MRPTLARTSSAASGLRFCGMIEEPVVNLSERRTKPNCGVTQITISSASRDRCMARDGGGGQRLEGKVAVGDGIERIGRRPLEAQRLGRHVPVDRERRAGERGRAERALVEPLAGVGKPAAIAGEHLHVGQQMVAEGDGLRRLQMREARHRQVEMRLRLAGERKLQGAERGVGAIEPIAHVELEVGRDLIVARACRVQTARRARRSAPSSRLSTFMCTSSSAREKANRPASISSSTRSRPALIFLASSLEMMPWAASIAACAFEARMSWGARALSKPMEAFISCMTSAGDIAKRPPHILLAVLSVTSLPPEVA